LRRQTCRQGASADSPADGAGESATGARVPAPQPWRGRLPAPARCLSAPAPAAVLGTAANCSRSASVDLW